MYSTHLCLFLCVGVAYVIMIIDNIVMQRHNEHKRQEDRQTDQTDGSLTIADPFRAVEAADQIVGLLH